MKRTAAFFYSEKPKPGFTPVPIEGGRTGYVRGALCPPNTTLIGTLDWAHKTVRGKQPNYPEDECFMNGHYVSSRKSSKPALRPAIEKALRALSCEGEYEHLSRRSSGDQVEAASDILSTALEGA